MPVKLGGSAGGAFPQLTITKSQTWVPPQDGNICIHVIGGGGGGAGNENRSGGAGGYCKKNSLAVTTAGSFTITVGARGYRGIGDTPGSNGGNSQVSGTGLSTLTANGGTMGTGYAGNPAYQTGAGGSASGGNVNNTGGGGRSDGYPQGGGAVGIYTTGQSATTAGGGQTDAAITQAGLANSAFGEICGGRAGTNSYSSDVDNNAGQNPSVDAGDLSGGGGNGVYVAVGTVHGGSATIGGGGGANTAHASAATTSFAGFGGSGLVLIQYLPW